MSVDSQPPRSPTDIAPVPLILVVDDEWLIGEFIADALTEAGYAVAGPAGTVKQALALLADRTVAAAVLDVQLLNETSAAIVDELTRRGVPFTLMSGFTRGQLPTGLAGHRLLAKPVRQAELVEALRGLLG